METTSENTEWNVEMENDIKEGKLDLLAAQAIKDYEEGKYKLL